MKYFILFFLIFLLTACMTTKKSPDKEILISETPASVPLPTREDIIRTFFALINEHRPSEAVGMLSQDAVPDDSAKQAWAVQFNAFEKAELTSITPAGPDTYKVVFKTIMKPEAANAVIPNYGFGNGQNTRWITLVKDSAGLWKLNGLSTGP